MIKGGYKIVNFNGAALSGSSETLPGIYAQIVDDYDKPVMVSGVSLNGDIMDDAYAGVQEKIAGGLSKSVELTVYGGIITVTEDDEVTFIVSKTPEELTAEIGDLEDLETTDKDSVVDAINSLNDFTIDSFTTTSEDISASGNKVYTKDVTKTGYTPVGIVTVKPSSSSIALTGFYFVSTNTAVVILQNPTASLLSGVTADFTVIYRRNKGE